MGLATIWATFSQTRLVTLARELLKRVALGLALSMTGRKGKDF
jgi:hypothetical protein